MRLVSGLVVLGLVFQSFACGGGGVFVANVGERSIQTKVAARRWKSAMPLRIIVGPAVEDAFVVQPVPSMTQNYANYRKTIGAALKGAFAENFAAVELADKETRAGLELIIVRAEMQKTTTIKYGVALQWDGKELADVTGESSGKTIAMRGGAHELHEKYDGLVEELVDFTLESFAEKVYEALMRSERLETEGVYRRLQETESAPVTLKAQ